MVRRYIRVRAVAAIAIGLCGAVLMPAAHAATVTGTVTLISGDSRDRRGRNDSGVVVWLEPAVRISRANPPSPKMVTMDQRNKTFIPHVMAVEVGTAVNFPNNDPIDHNAFSNFDGQIFDVHLYSPQMTRRVVFRREGMVRVFCNIHETMSAVIAVLPTPYFAVTGADGRYEIPAPAGDYRLRFWHERAAPDFLARAERSLIVGEAALTLPETSLTVGRTTAVAHKDKYGHDYAAKPPEYIFYPGVRR